jgi:hypothetical protein
VSGDGVGGERVGAAGAVHDTPRERRGKGKAHNTYLFLFSVKIAMRQHFYFLLFINVL